MEFPYDKNELPLVELTYINKSDEVQEIDVDYNLFDFGKKSIRKIYLSKLFEIVDKSRWIQLFNRIKLFDEIIIEDDLFVINKELEIYKIFYLKVYYWNLLRFNKNIFVSKNKS